MRGPAKRGFTLLEVMIALAILGVALLAIVDINGAAIRTHTYAKRVTVGTMLARSKMVDLESKFIEEGFTSDFDQQMNGDFSDEGWADFRWEAEIIKPNLDAANATGMVGNMVASMGGLTDPAEKKKTIGIAAPKKEDMAGAAASAIGPMIESQMTVLTATIEKTVREVRLRVVWDDGGEEEEITVATHFVVLAAAGQPGGESNDPETSAALLSASASASKFPAPGGQTQGAGRGLPPGPTPDTFMAPNGQLTGPGIPRPAWVPEWIPKPPAGARYNPAVQENPKAPPFIWDVPLK